MLSSLVGILPTLIPVLIVVFIMLLPVGIFIFIKYKTRGRVRCYINEEDGTTIPHFLKIEDGGVVRHKDNTYFIAERPVKKKRKKSAQQTEKERQVLEAAGHTSEEADKILEKSVLTDRELGRRSRTTSYPEGLPWWLQQSVTTYLFNANEADPVDWRRPRDVPGMSPKEVGAALEPRWIAMLVKGASEGIGFSKNEKRMLFLSVAVGGIGLILIFALLAKIGTIERLLQTII